MFVTSASKIKDYMLCRWYYYREYLQKLFGVVSPSKNGAWTAFYELIGEYPSECICHIVGCDNEAVMMGFHKSYVNLRVFVCLDHVRWLKKDR